MKKTGRSDVIAEAFINKAKDLEAHGVKHPVMKEKHEIHEEKEAKKDKD